jgi:hypothetical protein
MPTIDDEIRSRTAAFADDLAKLVRRLALQAATDALDVEGGAEGALRAAPRRGEARRRAAPAPAQRTRPSARAAAKAVTKGAGRRKGRARAPGEKRPQAELARLTDRLGDYIEHNPGQRMEIIGKALGMPTRELNLPMKKLLAARKIRTEGHKRATEYFPT